MTWSMVDALLLRSGFYHFTVMALTLADRGEKLHSETLLLYFLTFPL